MHLARDVNCHLDMASPDSMIFMPGSIVPAGFGRGPLGNLLERLARPAREQKYAMTSAIRPGTKPATSVPATTMRRAKNAEAIPRVINRLYMNPSKQVRGLGRALTGFSVDR